MFSEEFYYFQAAFYSDFKLSVGFKLAAFKVCTPTVNHAIPNAPKPATKKNQGCKAILKAKQLGLI